MSYRFFQNKECEYFPCHSVPEGRLEDWSCLFCFCPLYHDNMCGGNYSRLENGTKDCSNCTIPHYNYEYIIDKLIK